ncbi:unnamed protein product, partial [marine sediment metagenome]
MNIRALETKNTKKPLTIYPVAILEKRTAYVIRSKKKLHQFLDLCEEQGIRWTDGQRANEYTGGSENSLRNHRIVYIEIHD